MSTTGSAQDQRFAVYTDAAGVQWTLDQGDDFFGGNPLVVACDVKAGQVGFAIVGFPDFRLADLPPASDRRAILEQLREDREAWIAARSGTSSHGDKTV